MKIQKQRSLLAKAPLVRNHLFFFLVVSLYGKTLQGVGLQAYPNFQSWLLLVWSTLTLFLGSIYLAKYKGTYVAVKELKKTNGKAREEFLREVSIVRRLRHPNIITYMGACTEGSPWYITEYVFLLTLKFLLTRGLQLPCKR
jgi:hypothetical protein